jgi:hypothetical protein
MESQEANVQDEAAARKKRQVTFWVALSVPFFFIILILVKIVNTVQLSNQPHRFLEGIYPEEEFMKDVKVKEWLPKGRMAIEVAKKNTKILQVIALRKADVNKSDYKRIGPYGWIAYASDTTLPGEEVKEGGRNWNVQFREVGIIPYLRCTVQVFPKRLGRMVCKGNDDSKSDFRPEKDLNKDPIPVEDTTIKPPTVDQMLEGTK